MLQALDIVKSANFTGGSDSNDTGAIVRIGQFGNDRGFYIKGGRGTSDQAKAIFGLRNSANSNSDVMVFLQGGKIGVNNGTPSYPLDVQHSGGNLNQTPIIRLFQSSDGCHNALTLESNTSADKNIGIQFKKPKCSKGWNWLYSE